MQTFQDQCLTVAHYAKLIGKSRRTVQRYIAIGMPIIRGTKQSIHLPTVNEWWLSQISSKTNTKETNND